MPKVVDIFRNAWKTPDLRNKLLFTFGILTIFRILAHIPLPAVDIEALRRLFAQSQFLGLLNMFSGGALANFSIIALGLNPYINSTIIFQLLTMVFPRLEELAKEGESGQRLINQYTRFLTVPLAVVQSIGIYFLLRNQGIIENLSPLQLFLMVLTLTGGAMLLVWLGELLSEYGIGNGISILIFVGILSGLPVSLAQTLITNTAEDFFKLILFAAMATLVIGAIIFITEAQREVRVQYASRVRGIKMYGGQATHLPLRLNQAGVIPIIFAISLILLPGMLANFLSNTKVTWLATGAQKVADLFNNNIFYAVTYFFLVVGFTFFYTAVTFNPEKIANDIQKHGGFVPGIRPGKQTAGFLGRVLTRITLVGALFLGLVAVLPFIARGLTGITTLSLGGTGILIVVSVVLETVKSLEAMLIMRSYDGFLR